MQNIFLTLQKVTSTLISYISSNTVYNNDIKLDKWTNVLTIREYSAALTKIAKLRYRTNPKTLTRLLGDITAKNATENEDFDGLRSEIIKIPTLLVLQAYMSQLTQVSFFYTYTKCY